jgi:hypothetical protein
MKVDYYRCSWGGLDGKHVVATLKRKTGTISAFALGPKKTKKTLCRDRKTCVEIRKTCVEIRKTCVEIRKTCVEIHTSNHINYRHEKSSIQRQEDSSTRKLYLI